MVGLLSFTFLLLLGIVAQPMFVAAQETSKKANPPDRAGPLKVGDAAPALHVSKWLQGRPVTTFEPGKVYVIEFWAT